MLSTKEQIILLLGNGVFSSPLPEAFPQELSAEEARGLFQVAKRQDLGHIVCSSLKNNGIKVPADTAAEFQKLLFMSVYRAEKLQYELKRLTEIMEKACVPFIPLKGSVLRSYYPEPWMRTSSDIDLLIKEEDLSRVADAISSEAGYSAEGQWSGVRSFFSRDGIHLEVHFYDPEDVEECVIFKEIWDHVTPAEGYSFRMQMEWEFFYAHHVLHMAKHFAHGGCGIRPFMDLYLMRENIPMNSEKQFDYLKKFGLTVFGESAEHLASVWFGKAAHTPLTAEMEEYLLDAGIFGSISNQVALEKSGNGRHINGFWSHVWLPYDVIKHIYPVTQNHRWLVPFTQVARWFKLLFCGGFRRSIRHLHENRSVSDEKVKKVSDLMEHLNLK